MLPVEVPASHVGEIDAIVVERAGVEDARRIVARAGVDALVRVDPRLDGVGGAERAAELTRGVGGDGHVRVGT